MEHFRLSKVYEPFRVENLELQNLSGSWRGETEKGSSAHHMNFRQVVERKSMAIWSHYGIGEWKSEANFNLDQFVE